MNDQDNSENQNQLEPVKRKLEDVWSKGQQLNEIGSDLKRQGAFISDLANCELKALSELPSGNNNFQEIYNSVERLANSLNGYLGGLMNVQSAHATGVIFAGTATMDAIDSAILNLNTPPAATLPYLQLTRYTWQGFEELSQHPAFRDEALKQIERLGIEDTDSGNRAVKQLNAAWNSHLQMPNSPTESLITLRETIEMVLDELIKRRSLQRPVPKKEKIIEIGDQCRASHSTKADFRKLEDEWHVLKDELSKEKRPTVDRQAEMALMRKTTWLLTKFLTALDPKKLKPV